jgi:polar amino acid transport system substrate-binding protein/two-component system sensor histidine kinase EvgS
MNLSLFQKFNIFFLFFIFLTSNILAFDKVSFTPEEKAWLQTHHDVIVGGGPDWVPFDFVNKDGVYDGIAKDYLELISKQTGLNFIFKIDKWSNNLKKIKDGSIDLLDAVYYTKERTKFMNYTRAYFEMLDYFFIRDDLNVKNIKDLDGKIVAIPKGYAHEEIIKKDFPFIKILHVDTFFQAIDAVLQKKADILFDTYASLSYILKKESINTIIPFKAYRGKSVMKLHMTTTKNKPILASIIDKALYNISNQDKKEIYYKWLGKNINDTSEKLQLTKKEQEWIDKHPVLKYSEINWEPMSIIEHNKMIGIMGEYIKIISKKTGIKFQFVPSKSWNEVLEKFKNKKIDMIPGIGDSDYEAKLGLTSKTYAEFPFVLVTKTNESFINNIDELANTNKIIAVPKYYTSYNYLKENKPNIKIVATKNIFEALELVKNSKAYAFLGHMAIAMHYIGNYYPSTLHISGKVNYYFKHKVLLQKDDKTFLDVVNKVLNSITEEEHLHIKNKWIHVQVKEAKDYTVMYQIAFILLLIIFGTFYWNRKLTKEIQERKELEKKLLKAKRVADAANKSKSEFLANMSHEIRTPMNAIVGFTELLNEQLEEPRLKAYVKTIQNASNTLLTLINDILDLSKIEAGKLKIKKTPTNLTNLANEVSSIFTMSIQKKGLELLLDIDKDIPSSLLLDEVRLRQILFNLIGNAVKFTQHGFIKFRIRVFDVKEHLSKLNIEISIEDSGIGIAKDQLEKIFKEFEQTDGHDSRKFGGTGLGLSISKRLSEMMGGDISVKSIEGKGTTFSVHLYDVDISSIQNENQDQQDTTNIKNIIFHKATILVVDDIQDNRELIKKNFEDTNVNVITANDGYEALEAFKEKNPDLVLMDIRMPNMDGYEASKRLKEISDVPIIALTASVMQSHEEQINKNKYFDGYLRKPVLRRSLYLELSKFLDFDDAKEVAKDEKSFQLSDKAKSNLDIILNTLDGEIKLLYKKVTDTNNIADIKDLAQEIEILSKKYDVSILEEYSSKLKESIEAFDIVTMQQLLKDFDSLSEKLSKSSI